MQLSTNLTQTHLYSTKNHEKHVGLCRVSEFFQTLSPFVRIDNQQEQYLHVLSVGVH